MMDSISNNIEYTCKKSAAVNNALNRIMSYLEEQKQSRRMLLSGVTMSSPFIALHYGHNQMEDRSVLRYIVDAEQFPYTS